MSNDPFFKDPNYIDTDAVEQMFLKLDYKLDKVIKMLNALNSNGEKKITSEIPAEAKEKMKIVLEKHDDLLTSWEKELFKDLSSYPRWSEKQKSIYDKIIAELSERKTKMDELKKAEDLLV